VPLYAIVEDRYDPLATSRYLTGAFVLETGDLEDDLLLNEMATIGKALNRPMILVPTDDGAAVFIAEHANELRQSFLFPHLPAALPGQLTNKSSLYDLCKRFGVPCPENVFPKSIEDVHEFIERAIFPVIFKATSQWRPRNIVSTTLFVKTPEELLAIYRDVQSEQRPNVMFQEYIPGDDWILHGYCSQKSNCFLPFTGRKLRSYPPFAGFTTLGMSVTNEQLASQTQSFVRAIGYSGIMDIDYRFDKRDDKYKLLDFNPRVGANFRMFDDQEGINVVRALHLDLTDRCIRRSPLVESRVFIVEPYDLAACYCYWRSGDLTIRELQSSFLGSREFAWFNWRDPLPFLSMSIRLLLRVVSRLVSAVWR
jgi:D-aspartate ligase